MNPLIFIGIKSGSSLILFKMTISYEKKEKKLKKIKTNTLDYLVKQWVTKDRVMYNMII